MPLLIDGHNLIGKLAGIDLSDPDDERQLIDELQEFCQRRGRRAVVYFDQAAPFSRDPAPSRGVTVHFVRAPRTADAAIQAHLKRLGGAARNWTIVSSDRDVLRAAARAGARGLLSEQFARELRSKAPPAPAPEKPSAPSADEVHDWLRLFRSEGDGDDPPQDRQS